jgi:glycine oxidase
MTARLTVDTAIIGGGVIGLAAAWRLAQAGLRVAIIERGEPGREASHAAGGMLAPLAEADSRDAFFDLAVASRSLYSQFAAELYESTGIDIEYRTEGTLYLSLDECDDEELQRRWEWQHAAGLNVEKLDASFVRSLEPQVAPSLRWALKFPDDHQVENRRLVAALASAARTAGVEIISHTDALRLRIETIAGKKRIAGVVTTRGEVRAGAVVLAAGSWSGLVEADEPVALADVRIEPVRGQMISLAMPMPAVGHVIYSRRGYVIPRLGGALVCGSTSERAGFDKRVTAGGIAGIIDRAAGMLPAIRDLAITEMWAGLRPFAGDGWPILGGDPQVSGLVYATGHYRNGILLAPITAEMVTELIAKGEVRSDISAFSVSRFADRAAAG